MYINTQCRRQNRKKETQETHKGHAHKPHRMFTLKQEAKCCNCLSFLDKPTFSVSPEYVLNGTHYSPPSSLTHIGLHTSTPRVKKGDGGWGGGEGVIMTYWGQLILLIYGGKKEYFYNSIHT